MKNSDIRANDDNNNNRSHAQIKRGHVLSVAGAENITKQMAKALFESAFSSIDRLEFLIDKWCENPAYETTLEEYNCPPNSLVPMLTADAHSHLSTWSKYQSDRESKRPGSSRNLTKRQQAQLNPASFLFSISNPEEIIEKSIRGFLFASAKLRITHCGIYLLENGLFLSHNNMSKTEREMYFFLYASDSPLFGYRSYRSGCTIIEDYVHNRELCVPCSVRFFMVACYHKRLAHEALNLSKHLFVDYKNARIPKSRMFEIDQIVANAAETNKRRNFFFHVVDGAIAATVDKILRDVHRGGKGAINTTSVPGESDDTKGMVLEPWERSLILTFLSTLSGMIHEELKESIVHI